MMAEILVNKFPFIFIDESQDTNKDVINSFFHLKNAMKNKVIVGLFGDTMQRIFGGGEKELGKSKPDNWVSFEKKMNHRSARRIVGLGNQIRSEDDKRSQYAREGAVDGYVRYFLLPQGALNKDDVEAKVCEKMTNITGDDGWKDYDSIETAVLLLEHKMAGSRLGFHDLLEKLSESSKIKDRIFEGENTELNFFSNVVFPIAEASKNLRRAELMSILREQNSPLLEAHVLEDNKGDPLEVARNAEYTFREVILNEDVSFRYSYRN